MAQMTSQQVAIKAATKRCIDLLGGLVNAAQFVPIGKSQLQRYYNMDETDQFIRTDIALVLDEAVGEPIITGTMAKQFEQYEKDHESCPNKAFVKTAKEIGELLAVFSKAIEDGEITINEARSIATEAVDVEQVVADVVRICDRAQAGAA